MHKNDSVRLKHMIDAAKEAISFTRNRSRKDLDKDRILALALVRLIEVIGEAAGKISPACQAQYPEIPWRVIVAMRNRLIHAYFDIDLDRVWDTVTKELAPLVAQLEKIAK